MRFSRNELDEAADFISGYCRTWGRMGGQSKEKYGTVRFYVNFYICSLHNLFYPGYYYYTQYPKWIHWLDVHFFEPILSRFFAGLLFRWQKKVYSDAYNKAVRKWPHLTYEILCCADWPEYIENYDKYMKELVEGEANETSHNSNLP